MQFLGILLLIGAALEILSIILVAKILGGFLTFVLIVLSFFAGSYLISRNAGVSKVLMAGELLRNHGRVSLYQMLWPIRIPVAGCLLMIPGFVSSVCAILLLLPFKGNANVDMSGASPFQSRPKPDDDDIIDGDFVVRSQPNNPEKPLLNHRDN